MKEHPDVREVQRYNGWQRPRPPPPPTRLPRSLPTLEPVDHMADVILVLVILLALVAIAWVELGL